MLAKYLKNKCPVFLTDCRRHRNKLTISKQLQNVLFSSIIFSKTESTSETWKCVNQLMCKHKIKPLISEAIKTPSGKTITCSNEICNTVNEHFITIAKKLIPVSQNISADVEYKKLLGERNASSIFEPTDEYKVVGIISRLNNLKPLVT